MTDELRERLNGLPTREQFYADKMKWETVSRVTQYAYGVVDDAKSMIRDKDAEIASWRGIVSELLTVARTYYPDHGPYAFCRCCGWLDEEKDYKHADSCVIIRARKLLERGT